MDLPQQHSPASPSLATSYIDGRDQSAPTTTPSPVSPSQAFHNTPQVDAYPRQAQYTSTMVTSSNPVKPTKRKRLAKACDACHRSKRRCDGTLPCANCDFAGKSCTYTDPSGRAVAPPRTRSVDSRVGQVDGWPYPVRNAYGSDPGQPFQRATPVPTTLDPSPSPLDATLTRELVNLFFAHCHPYTLIIHRATFLHDLSRSRVPTYLLLAVFSLAAPHSLRPSVRTSRLWHAGERFATEAVNTILVDAENTSDLSDSLDSLRIRPCLELAQTLCLLQAHDCVMRRPGKTNRFMALAQDVLQAVGVATMDQEPSVPTYEGHVRNESMRRTFWLIYQTALLSSAFTQQPIPAINEQLSRLRLPVEEALFDLPRVENRPGIHPVYDYLPLPVGNKPCRGEFANLIRVCHIYAGVVSATSQKVQFLQVWDPEQVTNAQMPSVSSLEVGLRRWLELLPDSLRLTEENLGSQLSQFDGGGGTAAWAFTYMHALAETTVLALHEFADVGAEIKGPKVLALREQKALENLMMILGAMGQRGRANILMATFLVAIGKHISPQDPQVANWFDEYFRMWGVSYEELMNNQFRASWCTVKSLLSIPSRPFADGGGPLQLPNDFDYEMDFVEPVFSERSLSGSDSSSNEQSIAPSALTDTRGTVDSSTSHISASRYYNLSEESQMMQDFSRPSGRGGGLANGLLQDIRLMRNKETNERFGALVVTAGVNATLRSGAPSRGPSRKTSGGFIGERLTRKPLPALVTNGSTGRAALGLNNQDLYSQTTGAGVSEESGSQSTMESPSLTRHGAAFPVQPQACYGSRLSPHSVSSYTGQTVGDSDLRVDGINWLADGTKMQ